MFKNFLDKAGMALATLGWVIAFGFLFASWGLPVLAWIVTSLI